MTSLLSTLFLTLLLLGCRDDVHPLTKSWERPIPLQKVPEGLRSLRAAECGECHTSIYAEWKASTHALALQDPQFQAEWAKDNHLFVCRNCHTPLQDQQETIVTGLIGGDYHKPAATPNASFDPLLKGEAITCAVCHVRDGAILGPYGTTDAPHPVKKAPEALSAKLCATCHNVQDVLSATLVCTFSTNEEWETSPYPALGKDCITCHMPTVKRSLADGFPERSVHRHTWAGGGIAKLPGRESEVRRGFVSGLDVAVTPSKKSYTPGETTRITLVMTNQRAGHILPTGDVERFILVTIRAIDANARAFYERKERIGEVWEWRPAAKKVSDNSLKPLERRIYDLSFRIPLDTRSAMLTVIVENHRMTEENAKSMGILGQYPLSVEVSRIEVPLVSRKRQGEKKGFLHCHAGEEFYCILEHSHGGFPVRTH